MYIVYFCTLYIKTISVPRKTIVFITAALLAFASYPLLHNLKTSAVEVVTFTSPTEGNSLPSATPVDVIGNIMVSPYANVRIDLLLDGVYKKNTITNGSGAISTTIVGVPDGAHTLSARLRPIYNAFFTDIGGTDIGVADMDNPAATDVISDAAFGAATTRPTANPSGEEVWVGNQTVGNVGQIAVIQVSDHSISHNITNLGSKVDKVTFDDAGTYAYATDGLTGKVFKIDTSTYSVVSTFTSASGGGIFPAKFIILPGGTTGLFVDKGNDEITKVQLSTMTVVGSPVTTHFTSPNQAILSLDGTKIYIMDDGNGVEVRNSSTLAYINSAASSTNTGEATMSLDGTKIYIPDSSSAVDVFSTASETYVASISVGTFPTGTILNHYGTELWVINALDGTFSIIDTASDTVSSTVPAPTGNPVYGTVQPEDPFNLTDVTTPINFTVGVVADVTAPTVPGKATTTTPTTSLKPTWSWTASTDAVGLANPAYTVEWSQDTTFGSGINSSTTNTNSYTHTVDLSIGTWYFRVKAKDTSNNFSAYSVTSSVDIIAESNPVTPPPPPSGTTGGSTTGGSSTTPVSRPVTPSTTTPVSGDIKPENIFTIKLTLQDADGNVLKNAKVTLVATGETKTTNDKGEVTFSSLRAASYKLSVEHDGKTDDAEFKITDTSNLNQSTVVKLQAVAPAFPWWILLVVALIAIVLFFITKKKKKKDHEDF